MAGDWLKIEKVTPEKPEVEAMADALGIDPDAVFGKLFRVWRWFDDHSTDECEPVTTTEAAIDRRVMQLGFAAAMKSVGWLEGSNDGHRLPNFNRHNSETAKRRQQTAQRVAKHRRNAGVTQQSVTGSPVNKRETISRSLEREVRNRDESKCVYCGREEGKYSIGETRRDGTIAIDHVIPVTKGGDTSSDNLVCACVPCNSKKGNRTPDEADMKWPVDTFNQRYGSVTDALPREEKRRVRVSKGAALRCAQRVDHFEDEWWPAVHFKTGKAAAKKAYSKVISLLRTDEARAQNPHEFLLERMTAFAMTPRARTTEHTPIHPATWLNQGCYDDDPTTWGDNTSPPPVGPAKRDPELQRNMLRTRIVKEADERGLDWTDERIDAAVEKQMALGQT